MPTSTLSCAITEPAVAPASTQITYSGEGGPGRLVMTGAQSYAVDLAMMPAAGLRGLRITVDDLDAAGVAVTAPITIRRVVNSITINEPLGPGGWLAFADPAPVAGTTALTLISTANAVVHVVALG